jgi:hypothetical protein
MPIKVLAGTTTFSGSTRPSYGIAAAAPKPDAPRAEYAIVFTTQQ